MNIYQLLKNKYYRNRPMVKYWKTQDAVEAKVYQHPDGHYEMQMKDEDYAFPGFPRGSLLFGKLSPLKHWIKNKIFNDSWALLEEGKDIVPHLLQEAYPYVFKLAQETKYDMLPPEKMVPPVKELYRALDTVGAPEWRDIISFIFQEDDAYRFRFQWMVKFFPRKPKFSDFVKGLEMMEHAEMVGDMKERVRLVKRVLTALYQDPAHKAKWDAFLKEVDWKKVGLSKADKYFFAAKYFKVYYPAYNY